MFIGEKLENNQVWLYIAMLMLATLFGFLMPGSGSIISIIIALLMYSMFSQIPFTSLKKAFGHSQYLKALLTTNFIIVPSEVWGLSQLLPDNPSLLIGFYLVLLTPCINYYDFLLYLFFQNIIAYEVCVFFDKNRTKHRIGLIFCY